MTAYDYETVKFTIENGLAILVLNRPSRLNSFNTQMHTEVKKVFKTLRKTEDLRCLLITGEGRGFCAGQDLSDRAVSVGEQAPDLGLSLENNYNPLIRAITQLEVPVVCAVNGVAAGAGANIALACDLVFAARSAAFIQSFNKLGLIPDSGGTWMLPKLIGHSRAMKLCLLGEKVSASDALEMGMIAGGYEDDELMAGVSKLVIDLAEAPTRGLGLIKRAVHLSASNTLDQQLDLERDLQRTAGRSDDYREGVAAFMEKRKPNYVGH